MGKSEKGKELLEKVCLKLARDTYFVQLHTRHDPFHLVVVSRYRDVTADELRRKLHKREGLYFVQQEAGTLNRKRFVCIYTEPQKPARKKATRVRVREKIASEEFKPD